ncbi:MAG: lysylphosphatidylglycerol synthase transmembrane domain-containing protein [Chloroflexota bacterium]
MTEKPKRKNDNKFSQRLFVALGALISIVFLVIAFNGLDPAAFLDSLSDINLAWLFVGAAGYFFAVAVIAWRWQFLLRALRPISLPPLTQIVAIGYMGNNVYPLRAGEALRLFLLKRNHDVPVAGAATTVVIERVFDGIVMLSFILLGLLLVDVTSEQIQLVLSIAVPVFGIAVVVFFGLAAFPNLLRRVVEFFAGFLPERIREIVLSLSDSIIEGLGSLRSPLNLLGAIFASYATWAIEAGVYWIVMWAFGLDLGYPVALLVVGTVNLAGLIPASPGMVGVYEFFVSAVMVAVGIDNGTALAYAIVVHIVIWLPVTLVGFFFLVRYGLGWDAIRNANQLQETTS